MSDLEYRVSEGCLLRSKDDLITALVGNEWKTYPGMIMDWYTNSREPYAGEVEEFFREAGIADMPTPSGE